MIEFDGDYSLEANLEKMMEDNNFFLSYLPQIIKGMTDNGIPWRQAEEVAVLSSNLAYGAISIVAHGMPKGLPLESSLNATLMAFSMLQGRSAFMIDLLTNDPDGLAEASARESAKYCREAGDEAGAKAFDLMEDKYKKQRESGLSIYNKFKIGGDNGKTNH